MSTKKPNPAADSLALAEVLNEIERLLKQVGYMYNQYFSGNLKVPPHQPRVTLERLLRELATETIRNASQRHRYQNLAATYASMLVLWNNRLREKESGKRSGASARVQRYTAKRVENFLGGRKRRASTPAQAQAAEAPGQAEPAANEPQVRQASGAPGASVGGLERLYQQIAAFQTGAGQPLTFQSPEQLGKFLAVQKAKLEQQTGVKGVQIKLAIEGGKLKIKAQMPPGSGGA